VTNPLYFTDEDAARERLEALRWPDGPFCPHCGSFNAKRLPPVVRKADAKHNASVRKGVIQCRDCDEQYSVTVATVFERSKIPLHKWLYATHLLTASKKGISSHQLHRMLGVTYRTAWFMAHRIREAMRPGSDSPFGGEGNIVEVDETFIGHEPGKKTQSRKAGGFRHKMKVLAMIDRSTGRSKAVVLDDLSVGAIRPIIVNNVLRETRLMTDQAQYYKLIGSEFSAHHSVNHTEGEYVNTADRTLHTNTVESWFGIFKRGMRGIYQHCSKSHLHRYLAEFDFRYSNRSALGIEDAERADLVLKGIYGKRLMYRQPKGVAG
jgi:transposase-like protein